MEGIINGSDVRCAVLVARFNEIVTKKLLDGALGELRRNNVREEKTDEIWVPGSWELPLAAKQAAESKKYDALICIGIIIKGETDHYRHVSDSAVEGISKVSLDYSLPIGNCVLACNTMDQALQRAGGKIGNRGADAARAALEMVGLKIQYGI